MDLFIFIICIFLCDTYHTFSTFSYIIIGINTGFCDTIHMKMPDIFTTFFSDSVWTWVQTIVNSAGKSGEVGTGIGRVEFSTCTDIDNNIRTESVELSNVPAVSLSLSHRFRFCYYHVHLYLFQNIPYGQSSAKLPVTQSLCHLVTQSLGHSITW